MAGTVFAVLGSTNPTAAEMLPRAMLSTESTTEATSRPICCARSDRPFVALAGSAGQRVWQSPVAPHARAAHEG